MYPLIILGILGAVAFALKKGEAPAAPYEPYNQWGLPDVDADQQKGVYKRTYDSFFERAAGRRSVPFALIKAHALRESALDPNAYNVEGSRGLMQIYWPPGSQRLKAFGYSAEEIGDGSILFDPEINSDLGAQIIADNLVTCEGALRDAINMYNTGKKESVLRAPGNYVDDVLKYYGQLTGRTIA